MDAPNKSNIMKFMITLIALGVMLPLIFVVSSNFSMDYDSFRAGICEDFASFRGSIAEVMTKEDFLSAQSWGFMAGRLLGGAQKVIGAIPIKRICPTYQKALFTDPISFGRWAGKYGALCWKMYDSGSSKKPLYASGGNPALCAVTDYDFDKEDDKDKSYKIGFNSGSPPSWSTQLAKSIPWASGESKDPETLYRKDITSFTVTDFIRANVFYNQRIQNSNAVIEGDVVWFKEPDSAGKLFSDFKCALKETGRKGFKTGGQSIELDKSACLPPELRFVKFTLSKITNDGKTCGTYGRLNVGFGGTETGGCTVNPVTDTLIVRTRIVFLNTGLELKDYFILITSQDVTKSSTEKKMNEVFGKDTLDDVTLAIQVSQRDFDRFVNNIPIEGEQYVLDAYLGARLITKAGKATIAPAEIYSSEISNDELRTSPCSLLSGDFQDGFGDDDDADPICWPWDDSSNACDNRCEPLSLVKGSFKFGYWDWTTHYEDNDLIGLGAAGWSDCNGVSIGASKGTPVVSDYGLWALIYGDKPQVDKLLACIVEDKFAVSGKNFWQKGRHACLDPPLGFVYDAGKNEYNGESPVYGYCEHNNQNCGGGDFSVCT